MKPRKKGAPGFRSLFPLAGWLRVVGMALLVATTGNVARADDSELFLGDPDAAEIRANVLFIIDTSGSMGTLTATQAPYDAGTSFSGCYRGDSLYFTASGTPPPCDSDNYIPKSANFCAEGKPVLAGVGYYTDNLLSWDAGRQRWDALDASRRADPVECEADRGMDGGGDAARRFAADGPDGPWDSSAGQEPGWSSRYTVYDGNWLNWNTNPPIVERTRLDIVKDAVGGLLQSLDNVNVGIMRFNREEGGRVVAAVTDLSTSRDQVTDIVDGLTAAGQTPLSETLYEATQYFMGRNVDYGNVEPPGSVAESRTGGSPTGTTYRSPITEACGKNFIILLTDGEPAKDVGADDKIKALPGFASIVGANCDGSGDGACLDDLAAYLHGRDLNTRLDGVQNVTTHTIGFTLDLPLLASTAARGGGEYHLADDTASLSRALSGLVQSIADSGGVFAAPAVPVNAFNRTRNLNDVYVSLFQPSDRARWTGNLKKYRLAGGVLVGQDGQPVVDPDTGLFSADARSFWSDRPDGDRVSDGGAAGRLPASSDRRLYTNVAGNDLRASANQVSTDNLGPGDALSDAFVTTPAAEREALVQWALGQDVRDVDQDGNVLETRRDMGDTLHVQPITVVYGGTVDAQVATVFVTTNDGFLHAFDTQTGRELWSFIPARLLDPLYTLYRNEPAATKQYGLDGEINAVILNDDGRPGLTGDDERAVLLFGMGRGGDGVFAVDVTDREHPRLLWEISSGTPGFGALGQTWSVPTVATVRVGTGNPQAVAVFGGGYDPGQDNGVYRTDTTGNAIYMVDLLTGTLIWNAAGPPRGAVPARLELPAMRYSIPAPVRPLDLNGDGLSDRFYVGDMGGQLWRFDIVNGREAGNLVEGGVLASLGGAALGEDADPEDLRRFYEAPDVVATRIEGNFVIVLNIGSGYRGHPLDTQVEEAFFSIRDFRPQEVIPTGDYPASPISVGQLADITNNLSPDLPFSAAGWQLRLTQGAGEKVLGESLTLDGVVFFTTFTPGSGATECSNETGTNRLYAVGLQDGRPQTNFDGSVDGDDLTLSDRSKLLLAATPVTDIMLYQDESGRTICAGAECLTREEMQRLPGAGRNAVKRTYWFQDEGP